LTQITLIIFFADKRIISFTDKQIKKEEICIIRVICV